MMKNLNLTLPENFPIIKQLLCQSFGFSNIKKNIFSDDDEDKTEKEQDDEKKLHF